MRNHGICIEIIAANHDLLAGASISPPFNRMQVERDEMTRSHKTHFIGNFFAVLNHKKKIVYNNSVVIYNGTADKSHLKTRPNATVHRL